MLNNWVVQADGDLSSVVFTEMEECLKYLLLLQALQTLEGKLQGTGAQGQVMSAVVAQACALCLLCCTLSCPRDVWLISPCITQATGAQPAGATPGVSFTFDHPI